MTISPQYAEELGRQVDELEADNERLRAALQEIANLFDSQPGASAMAREALNPNQSE